MARSWKYTGNVPEFYERELVPTIFAFWAPQLIAAVEPGEGQEVLDLACGTGVVAREASRHMGGTGVVVGLDMNGGMLQTARAVTSDLGSRLEWQEGNAESMPFDDGRFSIVYCQLGLQFFGDKPAGLGEAYRVLRPVGKLVVLVWRDIEHSPGFLALESSLGKHIGDDAVAFMRSPFALSDGEELRALMTSAGFQEVSIQADVGPVRFRSTEDFVALLKFMWVSKSAKRLPRALNAWVL